MKSPPTLTAIRPSRISVKASPDQLRPPIKISSPGIFPSAVAAFIIPAANVGDDDLDTWGYDVAAPPVLFDFQSGGKNVHAYSELADARARVEAIIAGLEAGTRKEAAAAIKAE